MSLIISLQNQRVKDAVKLRDRRQREKQGRIIIDGAREIGHALGAGVEVVEAFICESLCSAPESQEVLRRLGKTSATLHQVTPAVFAKLAFGDRDDGVLAVARTPHAQLSDLRLPPVPLIVVLEGIEKPGNIGAVLRSADAAGLSAVIVADAGTDLYNPNTIRASIGMIFKVPVCVASSREASDWLRTRGIKVYATRVDAPRAYTDVDFTQPAAIVLGSEANGLSAAWDTSQVTAIKLPMRGAADSLNVSAAAAVLFYEALRQRGCGK